VSARFVSDAHSMAEQACLFPTKSKGQCERETGRATNGRPYKNCLNRREKPTRKPEPVVWVPAAFDAISISKSYPLTAQSAVSPGCRGSAPAGVQGQSPWPPEGLSFQFESTGVQLVVGALLVDEGLVVAAFDDAAVVKDHDGVGIAHGG